MRDPGDSQVPPLYRFCRDLVTDDRGQSEMIGAVMLIAVTVMGTVGVVALGSTALDDTKDAMNTQAAEHTMTQFDAQVAEVALGSSEIKTAQLPETGAQASAKTTDDGWIRMRIINETSGNTVPDSTPHVFNHSLGAVVWERGNREIAYQGGGVWRLSDGNATMVSPPELHFRGETLTIPVVQVTGDRNLDGDVTIEQNNSTSRSYPNSDFANPFEKANRTINLTIKSKYYEGWADYLETRTEGETFVDHANQTVTVQLVADVGVHEITAGVGSTGTGRITFSGSGGSEMFVDSYNSSEGDYSSSSSWNGTIQAAGTVEVAGNAEIRGDIRTGGKYDHSGGGDVHGDVFWTDGYSVTGSGTHNGSEEQISGIDATASIDGFVNNTVSSLEDSSDNDNDDISDISGDSLDYSGGTSTITLDDGEYFLEDLTVGSGDTLELDVSSGNITIAVRDFADIQGTINVSGDTDNRVEIFILGDSTLGGCSCHFSVDGGTVDVPQDKSTMMWVYGPRKLTGEVNGGGTFKGVIYAPTASQASNPGQFEVGQTGGSDSEVFGGVIVGEFLTGPKSEVHFDQALLGLQAVPEDTTVVLVNYIQVTRNEVRIES